MRWKSANILYNPWRKVQTVTRNMQSLQQHCSYVMCLCSFLTPNVCTILLTTKSWINWIYPLCATKEFIFNIKHKKLATLLNSYNDSESKRSSHSLLTLREYEFGFAIYNHLTPQRTFPQGEYIHWRIFQAHSSYNKNVNNFCLSPKTRKRLSVTIWLLSAQNKW